MPEISSDSETEDMGASNSSGKKVEEKNGDHTHDPDSREKGSPASDSDKKKPKQQRNKSPNATKQKTSKAQKDKDVNNGNTITNYFSAQPNTRSKTSQANNEEQKGSKADRSKSPKRVRVDSDSPMSDHCDDKDSESRIDDPVSPKHAKGAALSDDETRISDPASPQSNKGAETDDTDVYSLGQDPVPDYDSDSGERKLRQKKDDSPPRTRRKPRMVSRWSDADTMEYRNGYPNKRDNKHMDTNLLFYTNQIPSKPRGDYIDNIHKKWYKDYDLLESHHGYIQWLFPIRESGMNFQAQELQLHEAESIKKDKDAQKRVLKSYEMMLDFYGIRLVDVHNGRMERAKNWETRFRHLNRSFHNYLRITRILKSLGEFGYEYLKAPFMEFIMREAFEENTLPNCENSCVDYWVHTLRNEDERKKCLQYIEEHVG